MSSINVSDNAVVITFKDINLEPIEFRVVNTFLASVVGGNVINFAIPEIKECEIYCQCDDDCCFGCDNYIILYKNVLWIMQDGDQVSTIHASEIGLNKKQLDTLLFCHDVVEKIQEVMMMLRIDDCRDIVIIVENGTPKFAFTANKIQYKIELTSASNVMAYIMYAISSKIIGEAK